MWKAARWCAAVLALGSCTTSGEPRAGLDLVRNGSFDAWCAGGVPCDWELLGAVERVPTWAPDDAGVSFPERLGALTQELDVGVQPWSAFSCIEGEVLVDGEAPLWIDLDFGSDYRTEFTRAVQGGSWHVDTFRVETPIWYESVSVRLHVEPPKEQSSPEHTVAHVRLRGTSGPDCEPLVQSQAMGVPCRDASECFDDFCADISETEQVWSTTSGGFPSSLVCSQCASDGDCSAGEVCGAGWGTGPRLARVCVLQAGAALGEVCGRDDQCGSGVCCNGRCSECCIDGACGTDAEGQCRARSLATGGVRHLVTHVCESGARAAGEGCVQDDDCAGECTGEPLMLCVQDGRTCEADNDCPANEIGSCMVAGVRDGTCG